MGYLVKNFTLGQNICVVNFGSDNLQNIANTFRSRIFGFLPFKHHCIDERNAIAGRLIAERHFIHIKAGKIPLKKCSAYGLERNQTMGTLKHTEGKEEKEVSLQTTAILDMHLKHKEAKEFSQKARVILDTHVKHTKEKELCDQATVLVFDIETTGFSNRDKIIEFAAQDLAGGKFSTFQSLVNPGCIVPNERIHGISTQMVNKPNVPRWKDLAPILIHYVQSRQKAGGPVLWVAHNARRFDVRFVAEEFNRCSLQIPSDWLFVDTLPLAREVMRLSGSKLASTSLCALREHYEIPLLGSAHRAMSDVNTLAFVLQKISFDLKLPLSGLLQKAFKVSDLTLKSKSSKV